MARLARVIAVDTPHHVTQRGNARQNILASDSDKLVYLQLFEHYSRLHQLVVFGYSLMSNHVHLIVSPRRSDSLALALKHTHGRYAAYFNASRASTGHVWQGRFYSCPLDLPHLWAALRYTELNAVRAGLAETPAAYAWSSAAAHCCRGGHSAMLDVAPWRETWSPEAWREFLLAEEADSDADIIRRSTHTGRPLGGPEFVANLERALRRRLSPEKGGRPSKQEPDSRQAGFGFGCP
jgi:putative transposase